jgi:copper resistance protein B
MRSFHIFLALIAFSSPVAAQRGIELMDRRTFVFLMADEFEISDVNGANDFVWDLDLSVGGDFHKFWFKTRGEHSDKDPDESEVQILYSKAILPFWDLQAGMRRVLEPGDERNWAAFSIRGLARNFFDVEAELFLAEGDQSSLRIKGEYELFITQRLILSPEVEIVSYGRSEPLRRIGSGLSEIAFDLRLRYEWKREVAPYIGLSWLRLEGDTRALARAAGADARDTTLSIGLRAWF